MKVSESSLIEDRETVTEQTPVPEWIKKKCKSLVKQRHQGSTVYEYEISHNNCQDPVWSFFCTIYFRDIRSFKNSESFLIKTPNKDSSSGRILLLTEQLVLRKIIPIMERTLKIADLGNYLPLTTAALDVNGGDNMHTIMEITRSFPRYVYQDGMPFNNCVAFMRYLAVFHASSVKALEEYEWLTGDSELPLLPDLDVWECRKAKIDSSLQGVICAMEKAVQSDQNMRNWKDKIEILRVSLVDRLESAYRRKPTNLRVLIHGLISPTRILFVEDMRTMTFRARLCGFEQSYVGSFANDLLQFLYSATSDGVIQRNMDYLIDVYRCTFNQTLEKMGLEDNVLTTEIIREEMEKQKVISLVSCFHYLPHFRLSHYLKVGIKELHPDVFDNHRYIKTLRILLPMLEAKGWLE